MFQSLRPCSALVSMAAFVCLLFVCTLSAEAAGRPNILWISCEDISSHLGCYGDRQATTPHLDQLAAEGVRFTNAFTCHGVCAPSRTGIITAMHPVSLGANHMRSKTSLPPHIGLFPQYLKEAGYYCTNNSKTDYNLNWKQKGVWDESSGKAHWKNREREDQPFFSVFNLTMTHESKIWPEGWEGVVKGWPKSQLHDPDAMIVPPLYPDTPTVRQDLARLQDIIMVMDQKVGELLQELEDAGLADKTIVLFWSDHGDGLPRAKRWVYDTGTLVPMIARIPPQWRVDHQGQPGSVDNQLINLIDLGPTMLNLAGVPVPDQLHGRPFLGPGVTAKRQYVHASRDRVDERLDMVRSVRDDRFRYVRNLMPWRPALQFITYSERNAVRQEMRRLLAEGTLKQESAQFFQVPRAAEELYDTQVDPYELNNLASRPEHTATLQRLRAECDRWQIEIRDAHLIPESILAEEEAQLGSRWQILHQSNGARRTMTLLSLAKNAADPQHADVDLFQQNVQSDDPAARWWALMGMTHQPDVNRFVDHFQQLASDPSPAVRIAAARGLRLAGKPQLADEVLIQELGHDSPYVQHAAILELEESGIDAIRAAAPAIRRLGQDEYVGRLAEHALEMLQHAP